MRHWEKTEKGSGAERCWRAPYDLKEEMSWGWERKAGRTPKSVRRRPVVSENWIQYRIHTVSGQEKMKSTSQIIAK